MKTYLFVPIFLLILAFSLVACGGEEATDTAVADTPAPVAEEATKTPIPASVP